MFLTCELQYLQVPTLFTAGEPHPNAHLVSFFLAGGVEPKSEDDDGDDDMEEREGDEDEAIDAGLLLLFLMGISIVKEEGVSDDVDVEKVLLLLLLVLV